MVELNHLKKNYSDFSLDLSFAIPEGRVSGLVGKNGAGKSTTIKAILGLIQPDGGTVTVFGKESTKLTYQDKQNLGVALAESGFSAYLTIRQIMKILKNLYMRFDEKRFLDLCTQLHLPLAKQVKEFSTGMKAKLRVITALCHNAKLLIMDEPTSGLDVEARHEILDMLRNYLAENEDCSILISSHISSDLENLCDDIYLIHDGRMIFFHIARSSMSASSGAPCHQQYASESSNTDTISSVPFSQSHRNPLRDDDAVVMDDNGVGCS